ncbi:MAG: tetratricopeptide repeat protein [Fuerstiella sp.]|nr:tetratricopeptide repeat protein [Fuerstiella sp.]
MQHDSHNYSAAGRAMGHPTESTPRRARMFWWLRKPIAALLATLFALALGEFVVRKLHLAPQMQAIRLEDEHSPYIRSFNPVLRYELQPGFQARFTPQHGYLRTRENDFVPGAPATHSGFTTVNSHGLRDVERPTRRNAGVSRIVLLGDSVVELVNYVADEQTIARQLEDQFEERSVEVINCGVAGYCTLAEVELLERLGLKFSPDQVVLLFVENDFWGFNLEHTLGGGIVERPALVESLFEHSHLFRQTALSLNLFHFGDELAPAEWHRHSIGDNNVVDGFRRLQQLSVEHNFDVLIAVWPSFTKDGIEDRHFLPGQDDLIVEHIAWAHGFPTTRLSSAFRNDWETLPQKPKPDWFYTIGDGMHPSPRGCQVAAAALHRVLTTADPGAVGIRFEDVDDDFASMVAQSLAIQEQSESMEERIEWVLRRQNRWVEAEHYSKRIQSGHKGDFVSAFQDKPDLLNEYHRTGLQFRESGQLYAALDVFQRALTVNPDHVDSLYHLGLTQVQLKRWQSARDSFVRVLQIAPSHAGALQQHQLVQQELNEQNNNVQ